MTERRNPRSTEAGFNVGVFLLWALSGGDQGNLCVFGYMHKCSVHFEVLIPQKTGN